MTAVLAPGDLALLRGQPLVPAVRITAVRSYPGLPTRWHWHHEAAGYGHAAQFTDDARDLIAPPPGYVPPPSAASWPAPGYYAAAFAYLDRNRCWLAAAFGAERIAVVRATLARRMAPDPARQAASREAAAIIDGIRRRNGGRRAA